VRRTLALALLLPALAARAESPRSGSFDLRFNGYRPDIDSEFGGTATPYANAFGTSRGLMAQVFFSRSLFLSDAVTVDLGFGAGYWEKYGVGVCYTCTPVTAGDRTSIRVLPLTLAATARLDWLFSQAGVPLAPYVRASIHDYLWWTYAGGGSVAIGSTGQHGSGQTMGWSLTGGLGLLLDFFDAQLGREMDFDTGINHTILYVDVTKAWVDDFGSKSSWNLSPDASLQWSLGLMFVF
jgi:hypothetical protein